MKLGRDVRRHNELDNWRNTHRYESVMATIWLLLTISETDPGLWDRLLVDDIRNRPWLMGQAPRLWNFGMRLNLRSTSVGLKRHFSHCLCLR